MTRLSWSSLVLGVLLAACGGTRDTNVSMPPVATTTVLSQVPVISGTDTASRPDPARASQAPFESAAVTTAAVTSGPIFLRATPPGEGVPNSTKAPSDATAQLLTDQAINDAARRFGIERSTVRRVSITQVTWPDQHLACSGAPLDGGTPTPGYRIVLEAKGQQVEYHASTSRVVLCTGQRP
ncbi:MAG: hypothetical protein NVS2B7_24630 [Herpetosiphon sp.]